jgi:hypothetical protein
MKGISCWEKAIQHGHHNCHLAIAYAFARGIPDKGITIRHVRLAHDHLLYAAETRRDVGAMVALADLYRGRYAEGSTSTYINPRQAARWFHEAIAIDKTLRTRTGECITPTYIMPPSTTPPIAPRKEFWIKDNMDDIRRNTLEQLTWSLIENTFRPSPAKDGFLILSLNHHHYCYHVHH